MTRIEFLSQLEKRIERLTFSQGLEFALDICNRLLPEYKIFYEQNNWGNPTVLIAGIEYVEQVLNGTETEYSKIEELLRAIEEVTPDTDDFGDLDGTYALNASVSILELLEYLKDKDSIRLLGISSSMTDTLDFKIYEFFEGIEDDLIESHPLMQEEFQRQLAFIETTL